MKASESMKNGEIFPVGMRVLVVDDDPICLLLLNKLLRQCRYQVTTCTNALSALELLEENKDNFDLVISDVHMPDMDGFKLLEIVGLKMDLPVIMMSANGETSTVRKGIIHGACDYLIKPVRLEELRNIWQHVVRKKNKGTEQTLTHEEAKQRHSTDDGDLGALGTYLKKRKDAKEEEIDRDDDSSSSKKPRVVWSVELHQKFVNAVNQLGIEKAVPKRILELMDVQGLTRENVASHLQKYRLYLKRINNHQQEVSDSEFGIVMGTRLGELNNLAAAQLSQQALISSLHSSLIGKLNAANMRSTGIDRLPCLQFAPNQGSTHGQPLQLSHLNQLSLLQHNQLSQLNLSQCNQLSHCSITESSQLSLPQVSHLSYPQVNQPSLPQISQISLPDNNPLIVGDNSILNFTSSDAILRQPSSLIDRGGSFIIGDEAAIQADISSLSLPSCLFDQFDNISQISKNKEPHISTRSPEAPSYFKLSSQLTSSDCDVKSMGTHDIGTICKRWQADEGSQENAKSGHIQGSSSSTLINNVWAKSEIGMLKVEEEGLVGWSESIPPISGALCYNEQACTSVEHKGKGVLDLSSLRVDNSSLSESFQLSDDILHLIWKQQQGGLGFSEDDLGADGSMLNDIYVQ